MSQFTISWQRIPNLLSTIRIADVLDILIVAYLIYKTIMKYNIELVLVFY